MIKVAGGQQNLGDVTAVLLQTLLISRHECTLPDGGRRLQVGQIRRTFAEVQPPNTRPNRPRTHQNNLAPASPQPMHLFGERRQPPLVQSPLAGRNDVGAHLHDDGMGGGQNFLADGVELRLTGEANDYVGKGMGGGRIVMSFLEVSNPAHWPAFENIVANTKAGRHQHLDQFFEVAVIQTWAARLGLTVEAIQHGGRADAAFGQSIAVLRKPG